MSGLEHRTKDRDGGPVDGRGVTPRAAGVSRPATGLAQIAEIAQISETSMKWAWAPGHDVPPRIAQIAEISPGPAGQPINMWGTNSGALKNAITEITEKRLGSTRAYNGLRVRPLPTARRLAPAAINSNPWGIDLQPNANEPKTATEITELPKFTQTLSLVSFALVLLFHSKWPSTSSRPAEMAGIRKSPKTSTKWASARCRAVWRKSAEISLECSLPAALRSARQKAMSSVDGASGNCGNCANLESLDEMGIGARA